MAVPKKVITRKSAAKAVTIDVPMTLTKETKGTYVFGADEDDAAVTTVYVRKSGFPDGPPTNITLVIA